MVLACLFLVIFVKVCLGLNNGLGRVPQMGMTQTELYYHLSMSIAGWNSWNRFRCNINKKLIKQTADAIVASGLAKVGYEYSLLIVYC